MNPSNPQPFTLTPAEKRAACQGTLPEDVLLGLRLFNAGEYFEAHEALETAWRAETGPVRELYRGILQVGIAYYKIQQGKYTGACKLFARAQGWLAPFPDVCRGIQVQRLRQDAAAAEQELLRLGPQGTALFPAALFRPVEYTPQETTA